MPLPRFDNTLTKAVVPLAPATLLRMLADVAADDALPILTVHLFNGGALYGRLAAIGADREAEVMVLSDPETGRLGYVSASGVVAVELHNPEPFQDLLTGVRV